MKQLPNVSALLYCTPWAILPPAHAELGKLYKNYLDGTLPAVSTADVVAVEGGSNRVSSGIAYHADHSAKLACVWLNGIVAKNAPDMLCGPRVIDLTKLDFLLSDLQEDTGIETVVLVLNTPGGSVTGLEETAALLREMATSKRLIAYADDLCASAGYYLAAACDEIYCAPSARIGSIGTYIAALDDSRAWEMEGFELKLFRVGSLKAIGHPGKQWTPEEEAYLQDMADEVGGEFRAWVTDRRPGIEDSSMQGQVFFAKSAPAGLVDGLRNRLDDLLAEIMASAEI